MSGDLVMVADYEAREMANKAVFLIEAHERECSALRKSQENWQIAALKILDKMESTLSAHAAADSIVQASIDKRLDGWNKWVISMLVTMLGGSLAIIGAFAWHLLTK